MNKRHKTKGGALVHKACSLLLSLSLMGSVSPLTAFAADASALTAAPLAPQAGETLTLDKTELITYAVLGSSSRFLDVHFSGGTGIPVISSRTNSDFAIVSLQQKQNETGEPIEGEAALYFTPTHDQFGETTVTISYGSTQATARLVYLPTWTVGEKRFEYAGGAFGAAAQSGQTAVLMRDLSGESVNSKFTASADKTVTVDLAGHTVGSLDFDTAAAVTVMSSVSGAKVTGTDTTSGGKITRTGVSNKTGKLTLKDLTIAISADGVNTVYGVNQSGKTSETILSGGSLEITGNESSAMVVRGITSSGGKITLDGCTMNIKTANSSATAICGAYVSNRLVSSLAVKSATVHVEGACNMVSGVRLAAAAVIFPAFDGTCSISGTTESVRVQNKVLNLGSNFSADAGSVTLLSTVAFTNDIFATVAEGGNAAAMAAAFAPAAADANYAGKSAVAEGQSLKWGDAAVPVEKKLSVPTAASNIIYNGREQTAVTAQEGYTIAGGAATEAGTHTATATLAEGYIWDDGSKDAKTITWSIAPAPLTASYAGESIAAGSSPALAVSVSGFVNGESAETATDYRAPSVTAPATLEAGKSYTLTPAGGSAKNYSFSYTAGTLIVQAVPPIPMYRLYNQWSYEHFYTASLDERNNLIQLGWNDEEIGWYAPGDDKSIPVYRLYNKWTTDHHYTMSRDEYDTCVQAGWDGENVGWYSDPNKAVPLYREYNPWMLMAGSHNYTSSKTEHDHLCSIGWQDEQIGWYGVPWPEGTEPK